MKPVTRIGVPSYNNTKYKKLDICIGAELPKENNNNNNNPGEGNRVYGNRERVEVPRF